MKALMSNATSPLGRDGVLVVEGGKGIRLPNGLYLKYPNLRTHLNESGKDEMIYDTKRGKSIIPNRIYGGKVIENVCQALARIVIGEQMLRINLKYPVVMTVHDAIACLAKDGEQDDAIKYVEATMRMCPIWATGLPLNCESGYGRAYGDC